MCCINCWFIITYYFYLFCLKACNKNNGTECLRTGDMILKHFQLEKVRNGKLNR